MKKAVIFMLLVVLLIPVLSGCNTASQTMLPRSMKGYELYSWQEEGQWHFTLITGTNRNKTLEEVTTGENKEGDDGWVNIHVTGVEEIKAVLNRVPAKEWVSWSQWGTVGPQEGAVITLELPPEDIITEIQEHALSCGIDFNVF